MCASKLLAKIKVVRITSRDSVKNEKTRLRDMFSTYNGLMSRVSEQCSRLRRLVNKAKAAKEAAQAKQEKEDADNKKKEYIKQAASTVKATTKGMKPHKDKDLQHSIHEYRTKLQEIAAPIQRAEELKDLWKKLPLDHPAILVNHGFTLSSKVTDECVGFLENEFKGSSNWTGRGRGARFLTKDVKDMKAMGEAAWSDGRQVLSLLTGAEANWFKTPWIFGNSPTMRSCAPEFSFLCSAKVIVDPMTL